MAYTGPDAPSSTGEQTAPLQKSSGVLARVTQPERTVVSDRRATAKEKTKLLLKPKTVQKVISLLD